MPLTFSHLSRGYAIRIYCANGICIELLTERKKDAILIAKQCFGPFDHENSKHEYVNCYKAQVFDHNSKKIFELI